MLPLRLSDADHTASRERLEALAQIFPEAMRDGRVNFEVLREVLGDAVETSAEKYGMTWHGKTQARRLSQTPSLGTLRPRPEESLWWSTTQNLMLEGDNLEVLKLLQKSYAGKVKLIYIDPPYNTGKEFVYADDFSDSLANYHRATHQVDDEGQRLSTSKEDSGRFHTQWLNMMYPRLRLARTLLRDDGLIFVSIDDSEVQSLKLVMGEIFGEENFIAQITWQRAYAPINLKKTFSENHDFVLCFCKNRSEVGELGLNRTEEANARYGNPDSDVRGDWSSSDISVGPAIETNIYEIVTPSGRRVRPPSGRSWSMSQVRLAAFIKDNRIWFGTNGSGVPRIKRFISEVKDRITPMTIWLRDEVGDSQEGTKELKALFDDTSAFPYPKPTRLIRRIVEIGTRKDQGDIVLDFFAGSGTTAHAVIAQNAADGGNRRIIMVQLDRTLNPARKEQKDGADFCDRIGRPRTLSEITKERLRRAAQKVQEEYPEYREDLGFRVFRLDASNIRPWNPDIRSEEQLAMDLAVDDHLLPDRADDDLLTEILLKRGYDLAASMHQINIAEHIFYATDDRRLAVCLSGEIVREDARGIAAGLTRWRKEAGAINDIDVIFTDRAFRDNEAKLNVSQMLKQSGIEQVYCL